MTEKLDDELLRTQEKAIEKFFTGHRVLTAADIEEFDRLGKALRPYKCLGCSEIVYSNEDFVVKDGNRHHRECWERIMQAAEDHREWERQEKIRKAQRLKDIEENRRKTTTTIVVTVTGLKRDIEAFESQLDEFAEGFNLKPWERVRG